IGLRSSPGNLCFSLKSPGLLRSPIATQGRSYRGMRCFLSLYNDKAAAWPNPEGVGCQVAALRSAAQKRPGRPGMHSSKCQCSRWRPPRKAKAAAFFCGSWSIADMNGQQSLSSCFVPGRYKMTGKSCFHLAREHLTTPIFSENVCTPKSNGRMN
ncbi:hypothetical protein NC656_19190, partial [Pseudomonas asiatica]|uniref:hypothetical protein n=3 Tax=Pseudomonas TaxID=286 RepID=UPI00209C0390